MPTGYTADIAKGITFEQFAMSCARAFGACITMRDSSSDTPIPKEFKPSTYHKEALKEEYKRLEKINKMTVAEAEIEAKKKYDEEILEVQNQLKKSSTLQKKYEDMLQKVYTWVAPADHIKFKDFMIKQIKESIEYDCDISYWTRTKEEIKLFTGEEWLKLQKEVIQSSIEYHRREDKEEIERVAGRNKWIRELRESLKKK